MWQAFQPVRWMASLREGSDPEFHSSPPSRAAAFPRCTQAMRDGLCHPPPEGLISRFLKFSHEPRRIREQHQPPNISHQLRLRSRRPCVRVAARTRGRGDPGKARRRSLARSHRAAAFSSEGETHHPPVHGWRAIAVRELRLQARVEESRQAAVPRFVHERPATRAASG